MNNLHVIALGEVAELPRSWLKQTLLSLCLLTTPAVGAVLDITADFRPDPNQPFLNEFRNTTPVSGYCEWQPAQCRGNLSSVMTPVVTVPFSLAKDLPDLQDGAMIRIRNDARPVTVTGPGGVTADLSFSIAGFGADYRVLPSVSTITGDSDLVMAHTRLWLTSRWVNRPPNCGYTGFEGLGANDYRFFWLNTSGGDCGKRAAFDISSFHFDNFNVSYHLTTPNPLSMRPGEYTGELTYTLGQNADITFGRAAVASEAEVTFRFTLHVEHVFDMYFPPEPGY